MWYLCPAGEETDLPFWNEVHRERVRDAAAIDLTCQRRGLIDSPLIENLAENQDQEFAGKQLEKAKEVLGILKRRHGKLSKVYKTTYESEDPRNVDVGKLFDEIKARNLEGTNFQIELKINLEEGTFPLRKEKFTEAIENIIRNASDHAFSKPSDNNKLVFEVNEDNKNLIINCLNNGKPLPHDYDVERYATFGERGQNSTGDGYGGGDGISKHCKSPWW